MTSAPAAHRPLHRYWIAIALVLIGAAAWWAYHPGLSGHFLFDDFVNLDALGSTGPVDNWRTFWRFVTSGTADPIGRPLVLLSFLVDAHDWPADPAPFLRTNLLLHLLNGGLLFATLSRFGRALGTTSPMARATALLAAGVWILHPLFVSTTLYVVQREAMLPATFVLLGLWAYAKGRMQFAGSNGRSGMAWMVGGIVIGTSLALLCKANGVLLPLLAWVCDATVLSRHGTIGLDASARTRLRWLRWLLLVLPGVLLLAYLAQRLLSWSEPLSTRPWTIGQRMLTEPRVIFDYLNLLLVPRSISTGLFNDDYRVSESLLHPASTLPALIGIVLLLASGLLLRRRYPRYSLAVLFFLSAQVLESTSIPLELYFEHRNYLPAMFLFWPLAHGVSTWNRPTVPVRIGLAACLLGLFATTTWQRAQLWGDQAQLAQLWARTNPDSSRAQAVAAITDLDAGHPQRALARLKPLWRQRPADLQVALNVINAECTLGGISDADSRRLAFALAHSSDDVLSAYRWLGNAIDVAGAGACRGMDLAVVEGWLAAALRNPAIDNPATRDQTIEPLYARIALQRGDPDAALRHFNRALAAAITPDNAARQASMLASAGAYEQALAHLDAYERLESRSRKPGFDMAWVHARVLAWQGYWPHEMAVLRARLHAAIRERQASAQ